VTISSAQDRLILCLATVFLHGANSFFPELRMFIIGAGLVSLLLWTTELRDKQLLVATAILGFAPMLGWFRAINQMIDVVMLFSSIALSHSVVDLLKRKSTLNYSILPALASGAFTIFWWKPLTEAPNNLLLARLLSGWDHVGHFYLFVSSKVHHEFATMISSEITNATVYGQRYPAGIHMSWAQWWRDLGPSLENQPSLALQQYFLSVVMTVGICLALIVVSISRIAERKWLQILAASGSALLFLALICFGHLSMTIWSGFPNFIVAITGTTIAGSIALKPSKSPWITLLIIAGASAMTTYNWYPLLLPVGPIVLYALWKAAKELSKKARGVFFALSFFLGLGIATPVLLTLSFGAKHLSIPGGINSLPANVVVLFLLAGLAIGLFQLSHEFSFRGLLVASPLLIAFVFQACVTIPIRLTSGSYPYYPQKIAYGMVFTVLGAGMMLCIRLIDSKYKEDWNRKFVLLSTAFLLSCTALTQVTGYVGPDWRVAAPGGTLPGVFAADQIANNSVSKYRISNLLISLETSTSNASAQDRDCLILNDTEMQEYDPVLVNYWVGTLTWSFTEEHLIRSQGLAPMRTGQSDPIVNAKVLNNLLSMNTDCPAVTRPVAEQLIKLNPEWAALTWVIESDGHITKYAETK